MFEFKLSGDQVLRVTAEDARRVRKIASLSGLYDLRPMAVITKVKKMSEAEFVALGPLFETFFKTFENSTDLAVASTLFSSCRKSEKLAAAFEVVGVTRLLRTVLTAVWLAVGGEGPLEYPEWEFATFDEFGTWYNSKGFESASWLELLDLSKWPESSIAFEVEADETTVRIQFNDVSKIRALATTPEMEDNELFKTIVAAFDGRGDELNIGLSLLGSGSKSAKLAAAWDMLGKSLSRRAVWKYLRAFLLVLFTLAGHDNVRDDADDAAISLLARVFPQNQSHITFDDFADWYTQGGFQHASWLELLDLNKWLL